MVRMIQIMRLRETLNCTQPKHDSNPDIQNELETYFNAFSLLLLKKNVFSSSKHTLWW